MRRAPRRIVAGLVICVALAALALVTPKLLRRYYTHGLNLVIVAKGLDTPWAMAFLPDGRLLVTERPGRLRIVERDGRIGAPLAGLPPVQAIREGGLMDVVLDPHFADNRRIYWSYSEPDPAGGPGASTAVARGRLDADRVGEVQVIYRQPAKTNDMRHFGSRLLFGADGRLFVGLGDRYLRDDAQSLASPHGKIVRIDADGSIPPDNPFAKAPGALAEIWSYGHRNVQGLAFEPGSGRLWASEHGPQGGDELNLVQPGHNYGWPVVTYGCEYASCAKIGEGVAKPGMEQPALWWGPESEPPTALLFVTGQRYPQWRGELLMGNLRAGAAFRRIRLDGDKASEQGRIYLRKNERVRDLKQGPDGWIYVLVDLPEGRLLRLEN